MTVWIPAFSIPLRIRLWRITSSTLKPESYYLCHFSCESIGISLGFIAEIQLRSGSLQLSSQQRRYPQSSCDRFWKQHLDSADPLMLLVGGTPSSTICDSGTPRESADMVAVASQVIRYLDRKGKAFDLRPNFRNGRSWVHPSRG
jgi:hypothetical protein